MDTLSLKFETCEIDRITPYARIGRIAQYTRRAHAADWRGDRTQSTLWQILNLNPFGGSKIAAELGGWSCLDMDSGPRCVDVTVRCGEHLTGRTATPDGDGWSFAEMAQLRHPALDRKGRAQ